VSIILSNFWKFFYAFKETIEKLEKVSDKVPTRCNLPLEGGIKFKAYVLVKMLTHKIIKIKSI